MVGKTEMIGMMMSEPAKIKGTMDHMVNMAANDSIMFNNMIQMMKDKPQMWNKVMKMTSTTNTK